MTNTTDKAMREAYETGFCPYKGSPDPWVVWQAAWQAALASSAAAPEQAELTTCNCRWNGDTQVQQCTLHEAHVQAIHEWAERAKTAEATTQAQPAPAAESVQNVQGSGAERASESSRRRPVIGDPYTTGPHPSAPLSEPTAEGVTDDQWIELSERHATRDWNSDKPDGYLNAVKALCTDFAALSPPASSAGMGCVQVGLLKDAAESIDDYRAGLEFRSFDRKTLGALKAAIASKEQP